MAAWELRVLNNCLCLLIILLISGCVSLDPTYKRPAAPVPAGPFPAGFEKWRATNLKPQSQDGYFVAIITLPLGDLACGVGTRDGGFGTADGRLSEFGERCDEFCIDRGGGEGGEKGDADEGWK